MRSEKDLHKRSLNLMVCRARRRRIRKLNLTSPIVKTFATRSVGLLHISERRVKPNVNGEQQKSKGMEDEKSL